MNQSEPPDQAVFSLKTKQEMKTKLERKEKKRNGFSEAAVCHVL